MLGVKSWPLDTLSCVIELGLIVKNWHTMCDHRDGPRGPVTYLPYVLALQTRVIQSVAEEGFSGSESIAVGEDLIIH